MKIEPRIQIINLKRDDPLMNQVEQIFKLQMEHLENVGNLIPMVTNGESIWRKDFEPAIGSAGTVIAAIHDDTVVGFTYGTLRILPRYLGGLKTALMTHFHVLEEFRTMGVGEQLLITFENWCSARGCTSIEVLVLVNDHVARTYWSRRGFQEEQIQVRKFI